MSGQLAPTVDLLELGWPHRVPYDEGKDEGDREADVKKSNPERCIGRRQSGKLRRQERDGECCEECIYDSFNHHDLQ